MSAIPRLVIELIGTFVFLNILLQTGGQPMAAGIALAAVVFFGSTANPAASLMPFLSGQATGLQTALFMLVQFVAAMAAVYFYKWTH